MPSELRIRYVKDSIIRLWAIKTQQRNSIFFEQPLKSIQTSSNCRGNSAILTEKLNNIYK